ncbi:hypothetical protein F5D26_18535 [Burkholderia pseudomallei]|nr:hypothetical protein F5D26_18535 [Burkholderia pseudomallei]
MTARAAPGSERRREGDAALAAPPFLPARAALARGAGGAPRQRAAAAGSRWSSSLRAASGMRGSSHAASHSTSFAVNT